MSKTEEALPPLPKRRRAMFCTKCGFSGPTEAEASPQGAPCQKCDYTAFVEEVDYSNDEMRDYARAALAQRQQVPERRPDGMPASADERYLRRLLAARSGIFGAYFDDGEAQGQEHGIVIDFMREPVADIDAKLGALSVARAALTAAPSAQAEPQEPLPFTFGQRRRLWDNSPGIHADAKSFAAFERIVQLVETAHGIGKQERSA